MAKGNVFRCWCASEPARALPSLYIFIGFFFLFHFSIVATFSFLSGKIGVCVCVFQRARCALPIFCSRRVSAFID